MSRPPLAAANKPLCTISTDKALYFHGDVLRTSVSCWNYGAAMTVDVYVAIFSSGAVFFLQPSGSWSTTLTPCWAKVSLGAPAELTGIPWVSYTVPSAFPTGLYALGVVLTKTGSTRPISELNGVFFTVGAPPTSVFYVDAVKGDNKNVGTSKAPWKTVSHALATVKPSASKPVTIQVAAGHYAASQNGETFPLQLPSFVHLRGAGAGSTILDAEGKAYHVIECAAVQPDRGGLCVVEYLTIRGGKATGTKLAEQRGGGVYWFNNGGTGKDYPLVFQGNAVEKNQAVDGGGVYAEGASIILHGNLVKSNVAQHAGGGVYAEGSSLCLVIGNRIVENDALQGAGLWCQSGSIQIGNDIFVSNTAKQIGGGVGCGGGSPVIDGSLFSANSAWGPQAKGGGLYCGTESNVKVWNAAFSSNEAKGDNALGGGVACNLGSFPKLDTVLLVGNRADGLEAGGGGFYGSQCEPCVRNCTFLGNTASSSGGAVHLDCCVSASLFWNNLVLKNKATTGDGGGICCDGKDASRFFHNTIVQNVAANGAGGGVRAAQTPTLSTSITMTDCILHGNQDQSSSSSGDAQLVSPTLPSYCCIEGWTKGGTKNIVQKPQFVSGLLGGYYVASGSPCVNAGSQTAASAAMDKLTTSASGTPDVGQVDVGVHFVVP